MALSVYNFLTKQLEPFKPIHPDRVGMYVCGPTVYDDAHLGHAKVYISFDVIHRYLRFLGYRVRYVQNITDVGHLLDSGEDRMEVGASRDKLQPMEVAEKYTTNYLSDMDALGILRPSIMPRASGHIPEQIELVERLVEKGNAYEANGSVYFSVETLPTYGRFAGRNIDDLMEGVRIDSRSEKRNPLDFALWKKAEPEHIMQWNSPWGRGYPGWHIECTAMSAKYLGIPYDIHGGGIDNLFPHNESEIAQADAAYGKGYAHYWLLAGTLTIEDVKMSKSLGNVVKIHGALRSEDPMTLRLLILTGTYRSPLSYSEDALESARNGARRLNIAREKLLQTLEQEGIRPIDNHEDLPVELNEYRERFLEAMNDDFNTPRALGVLFDIAHRTNNALDREALNPSVLAGLEFLFRTLGDDVLGLYPPTISGQKNRLQSVVDLIIELRSRLRTEKRYDMADMIRSQLSAAGIVLEDGPQGTTWRVE